MSWVKIHFDNYAGNYKPNDTIVGRLQCHFRSEKTVRGIKVRFEGVEHTEWMDSESYYDSHEKKHKSRRVRFTGNNQIFSRDVLVYGSSSGSTTIAPGEYTYPFSLQLPRDLPGTYDCSEGYIRYSVKGIVDRPLKFDIEDEVIYFMYSPINFNLMSRDLQEPVTISDSKNVCCWCCSSGPIELDVTMSKRAFVPGEKIVLNVFVSNLSNVSVDSVTAELEQRLEYHVRHPSSKTRGDSQTLSTAVASGIGAHGENEFQMILDIPNSITIPNFRSCRLFRVDYKIQVECELPGCHINLDVQGFPELGHIQFEHAQPVQTTQYVQSSNGYPSSDYTDSPIASGYPGSPVGSGYPGAAAGNNPPYPVGFNSGFPTPGAAPTIGFTTSGVDSDLPPAYPAGSTGVPPYPPASAPYPGGAPIASGNGDDFEIVGGGPSTASGITGGATPYDNHPKAKEAAAYGGGGAPSAPSNPASAPPPTYDETFKGGDLPYPPQ